jgi:hypothetical protein
MSDVDDCTKDMAAVKTAEGNIRSAVAKVNQMMTGTWVGSAADKWGTDFHGRMSRLTKLLDQFPAEEQRLIAKARKAEKTPKGAS